jgi:hypothetical protein
MVAEGRQITCVGDCLTRRQDILTLLRLSLSRLTQDQEEKGVCPVRSIFSRTTKRYFIIGQLVLLTAVLFSMFLPRSGFTSAGVKQIELVVKNPRQAGPNGLALWLTNLGSENTKVTVGTKPFDATVAEERPYASEVIAVGKTVRLDDSLPATFRGFDTLFIRSHEEVATLMAPVDFPVNGSEFYSATLRQADDSSQGAPKWVSELAASYWLSTRPSITAWMPADTLEKKSKPVIAST